MVVGVDARPLSREKPGGIDNYLRYMLSGMAGVGTDFVKGKDLTIILYSHRPLRFVPEGRGITVKAGNFRLPGTVWLGTRLLKQLQKDRPDIFWGPYNILPRSLPRGCRGVLTLHDLFYKRIPETMKLANRLINAVSVPRSIRFADAIVAVSQSTKDEIGLFFPGSDRKTSVIGEGVSERFKPAEGSAARRRLIEELGIGFPYILSVGLLDPRKNIVSIYRTYRRIADEIPHHLVYVGTEGWKMKNLVREIKSDRYHDRVHFTGYLADELLPLMYSSAAVLLFPSLYEGFGLPPLEAMSCGCPVIASDRSSLPEVVGSAGVLVDPLDVDTMASFCKRFCLDTVFRDEYVKKGMERAKQFRWEDVARKMVSLFNTLI